MDPRVTFAVVELLLGAVMAALGAWQYVISAPLPGMLGRSVRAGQDLKELPPQRWQVSGAAMALFGLGFLLFGIAVLLEGRLDLGALGAIRDLGLLTWLAALVLVFLLLTRYRRTG